MINKRLERQEIERLLPWHAAGTLSRREADLVERALAGDTELAQRYDLVRQELAETIHLNETLGAPSERAMEKLFAAYFHRYSAAARCVPPTVAAGALRSGCNLSGQFSIMISARRRASSACACSVFLGNAG
jgi:hypothetical protein